MEDEREYVHRKDERRLHRSDGWMRNSMESQRGNWTKVSCLA